MYQVPMIFGMGDMDSSEQNIQSLCPHGAYILTKETLNKQISSYVFDMLSDC